MKVPFSTRELTWKTLIARSKDESGATLVEFAFSASVFLLLLFGILDFGFLFFAKLTLQDAVRTAGRYAVTGNCDSGNCYDGGNSGNRLQTILDTIQQHSFGLNPTVGVHCVGACSTSYGGGGNNAGGPGDTVQITATYVFHPIITSSFYSGGAYTITVSSSYKNELFQPAS